VEVARFPSPGVGPPLGHLATAADLTPDGARLALRVYTGVYEYLLPAPYALSALGDLTPRLVRLGPLAEPQGEALCYGWGGEGLWTGTGVAARDSAAPLPGVRVTPLPLRVHPFLRCIERVAAPAAPLT